MVSQPVARSSRPAGGAVLPMTYVITLVPVCAALNIVGSYIHKALNLPVYLDMIGTAIAAMVLGPWWGALVGVITNTGSAFLSGPQLLPFALVNITGALLWGYGVRAWKLGSSFPRFFLLNLIVALACTLVAAPIIVLVFGGATGVASDALTASFVAMGNQLFVAVFSSNILTSLADKIIGGFLALAVIEALPPTLTSRVNLMKATGMRSVLYAAGGVVIGVAFVIFFLLVK
ncbi:ECF transporter S component [Actinopolymorpha alba]|uniref:ECF transporter S component n=1 Tax=Actinopolymorpha alba TaxID=533267 RepID=UPI0003A5E7FE|nr:ECF transporter S component [Actinopolymorpha alba]